MHGRRNVFNTGEACCIDIQGGAKRVQVGVAPSRLKGSGGVPPEFFLEILDAKSCIFVHPESRNALQLWRNFSMTGQVKVRHNTQCMLACLNGSIAYEQVTTSRETNLLLIYSTLSRFFARLLLLHRMQ